MVTIKIVINSTRVMSICVTISCRYCIAFEVMLLVSSYVIENTVCIVYHGRRKWNDARTYYGSETE